MSNDAYLKTGSILDFSDLDTIKKGKYFSVSGWTGFYKGTKVVDDNMLFTNVSKYFAPWSGFYKGIKITFKLSRR
jgi:hypothetical protein